MSIYFPLRRLWSLFDYIFKYNIFLPSLRSNFNKVVFGLEQLKPFFFCCKMRIGLDKPKSQKVHKLLIRFSFLQKLSLGCGEGALLQCIRKPYRKGGTGGGYLGVHLKLFFISLLLPK